MPEVIIFVIWHPDDGRGDGLAAAIAAHFDGDAPVRDGLGMRIPVRVRSASWDGTPGGPPRPIDFGAADMNAVIVLQSWALADAAEGPWAPFVKALADERDAHPARTLVLGVAPRGIAPLPGLSSLQQVSTGTWPGSAEDEAWRVRLLLHIVNAIGRQLKVREQIARKGGDVDAVLTDRERLFLSHAKADGWGVAQAIEEHLSINRYGVETFVDATDLPGGARFDKQFDAQIANSALVVIRSDRHGTRPWCRWEVLRGKYHHRPLLVVDLIERGEPRIFPYVGNVPAIRAVVSRTPAGTPADRPTSVLASAEIERIVLAMLTEVLRVLVWRGRAEAMVGQARADHHADIDGRSVVYLVRTPELVDVAHLRMSQQDVDDTTVVYPDPPLDQHEQPLIAAMGGKIRFRALSELEVAP